jgi:hypothetical protein
MAPMDGTFAALEAALLAAWDRATLAVYADLLVERGDPRGELIAIDLELEQRSTPELVARRASLLSGWLGGVVPTDPHTPWLGDSFRLGFVEDLRLHGAMTEAQLVPLLASPLAPYLRRVSIRGHSEDITRALLALAVRSHGWLTTLSIHSWSYETPVLDDAVSAMMAAAPRLELLEVRGARVLESPPHPAVRRLVVTGWSALPALFEGEPWAAVESLDFAFYEPVDEGQFAAPLPEAPSPLPALQLPALRRLDLARNEPEAFRARDTWGDDEWYDEDPPDGDAAAAIDPLELVAAQPGRHRLTQLRVPSIRDRAQFDRLDALATELRALERLEIARGSYYRCPELTRSRAAFVRPPPWPWPRLDDGVEEQLQILLPASRSGDTVTLADAVRAMERGYEELAADARYAWTRLWGAIVTLGAEPWAEDARLAWTPEQPFPADLLVAAVEACEIGGSGGWRELRDELRFRRPLAPGSVVVLQRQRIKPG